MTRFEHRDVRAAQDHAAAGGQALHVWNPGAHAAQDYPNAPKVFLKAGASITWAHLFDQDADRLTATARRLGVRVIKIDRPGERGQHIDLCGRPLEAALRLCEQGSLDL